MIVVSCCWINHHIPLDTIKVSDAPTATNTSAQVFYGWNIAYDSIVSKGIWWLIQQQDTTITDDSWKSKSYGPVSIDKGDGARLDGKSGMPLWFVRALPRYH